MGVPKFYRWLSERYPLINQAVTSNTRVECDNLYLDMNGIVHNCTHGDDDVLRVFLTEEQIFTNVFKYLDKLFKLVRPRRLLYLALDGVAPRAKMNQQRQRRFRAAADAAVALADARRRGDIIGDLQPFDSNQITPGTEFMKRLSDALKYFIRRKIKEDVAWQRIKVLLSGAEVPGEGEHKLMLFIRNMKMQSHYEPNLRHCLYGLDADLIFLALVSHEPHFFLLREEVLFGKQSQGGGAKLPRKQLKNMDEFQLLHISLLRDYLHLEYSPLIESKAFHWHGSNEYDRERLIDDWVFLAYLVGNDFLPHLPTLDIGEGGLDTLFQLYKHSLPMLGGYITDHGSLNVERLEIIFSKMGALEETVFQKRLEEKLQEDKRQKRGRRRALEIAPDAEFENEEMKVLDVPQSSPLPSASPVTADDDPSVALPPSVDLSKDSGATIKARYYRDKFPQFFDLHLANQHPELFDTTPVPVTSDDHRRSLVKNYLEGLIWVQRYYYSGVPSWKWYFRYRYAPLASDMRSLKEISVEFKLGQPFRPLEQLLGVLPPASSKFLPQPYRELMTGDSQIADFYPVKFDVDMNGKRNPWEGIALIPFIEEKRLLDAVQRVGDQRLSMTEKLRNVRVGDEYLYDYDPNNQDFFPSPLPSLPAISECHSRVQIWQLPEISMTSKQHEAAASLAAVAAVRDITTTKPRNQTTDPPLPVDRNTRTLADYEAEERARANSGMCSGHFVPTVPRGCRQPFPGFPNMFAIKTTASLQMIGVNVFGLDSKKDTVVLSVDRGNLDREILMKEAEALLANNDTVWIDWPYLREAQLDFVSDGKRRVFADGRVLELWGSEVDEHQKECKALKVKRLQSRGVELNHVYVLASLRPFSGMARLEDGSIRKQYGEKSVLVPVQLVLPNNPAPDPRWVEQPPPTLESAFPVGSAVIYTGLQHYGAMGKIIAHTSIQPGNQRVSVELEIPPVFPTIGQQVAASSRLQFYPSYMVAKSLDMPPLVLAKVCSSVFVNPGRFDLGLKLRFSKHSLSVPEYARRVEAWVDPNDRRPETRKNGSSGTSYDVAGDVGGVWEYSEKAVSLLAAYRNRYPTLFALVASNPNEYKYNVTAVAPPELTDKPGEAQNFVQEIAEWLETVGISNLILVPCSSKVMADRGVKTLEAESLKLHNQLTQQPMKKVVLHDVPLIHIYPPSPTLAWSPTESSPVELGDRVMSIRSDTSVPLGMRGHVVAIHDKSCDVVLDSDFMTASSLNGRCAGTRGQTLPVTAFLNLSKPRVLQPSRAIGDDTAKARARQALTGLRKDKPAAHAKPAAAVSKPAAAGKSGMRASAPVYAPVGSNLATPERPVQSVSSDESKAPVKNASRKPAHQQSPLQHQRTAAPQQQQQQPKQKSPAQQNCPVQQLAQTKPQTPPQQQRAVPPQPPSSAPATDSTVDQASAMLKNMLNIGQPSPPPSHVYPQPHPFPVQNVSSPLAAAASPFQPHFAVAPFTPSSAASDGDPLASHVARSKAKRAAKASLHSHVQPQQPQNPYAFQTNPYEQQQTAFVPPPQFQPQLYQQQPMPMSPHTQEQAFQPHQQPQPQTHTPSKQAQPQHKQQPPSQH